MLYFSETRIIITAAVKFIKDTERFDHVLLLTVIKTILIPSTMPFLYFPQKVPCVTAWIFALMSYIFHLIVYKLSVR